MSPELLLPQEKELKALRKLTEAVAHDVNNLLSGILGYCELMKCEPASDSLKPQIEEMSAAGRRIASLIRILLALGEKYIYRPETLDLNKILLEMERIIPRILGSEIHFAAVKPPEILPILADPAKLKLVLITFALDMQYLISNNGMIGFEAGNLPDESSLFRSVSPGSSRWVMVTATAKGDLKTEQVQAIRQRLLAPAADSGETGSGCAFGFRSLVDSIGGRLFPENIAEREFRVHLLLPTASTNSGV
jgi:two-component system, cell cycle sensor histidine kinase and response regulator CckA